MFEMLLSFLFYFALGKKIILIEKKKKCILFFLFFLITELHFCLSAIISLQILPLIQ